MSEAETRDNIPLNETRTSSEESIDSETNLRKFHQVLYERNYPESLGLEELRRRKFESGQLYKSDPLQVRRYDAILNETATARVAREDHSKSANEGWFNQRSAENLVGQMNRIGILTESDFPEKSTLFQAYRLELMRVQKEAMIGTYGKENIQGLYDKFSKPLPKFQPTPPAGASPIPYIESPVDSLEVHNAVLNAQKDNLTTAIKGSTDSEEKDRLAMLRRNLKDVNFYPHPLGEQPVQKPNEESDEQKKQKTYQGMRIKDFATGFVPAFAQEKRAVLSSPSYVGHRGAVPMRSKVYKNAVINSSEIEVPANEVYRRMFGPAGANMKPKNSSETHAILNPAQQQSLGFNAGFIPNFSTEQFTAAITEAMKNGIASFAGGMIPNVSHSNTVNINDERSYQGNSDSMMDGILDILQSKFPKEMGKMGPRIAQR